MQRLTTTERTVEYYVTCDQCGDMDYWLDRDGFNQRSALKAANDAGWRQTADGETRCGRCVFEIEGGFIPGVRIP